jgi:hypothetical protein
MYDAIASVRGCFRCGQDHPRLPMRKLSNPTTRWHYWGLCPTTKEPLLAAWEPDEDGYQELVVSDPDLDAI